MRKGVLLLLVCAGFYFAGLLWARHYADLSDWIFKTKNQTQKKLDWGFQPAMYAIESRPFVVVVIARNNGAWVDKTLHSIFSQRYDRMRLIYIDDGSDDGSFAHARSLIERSGHLMQAEIVGNEAELGMAVNLLRAVESCSDEEIVLPIEGEGRLAHEWVLDRLNRYYAHPDLWLAYAQYIELPQMKLGENRPFSYSDWKEKGVRGHPLVSRCCVSFYASLFKKIDPADLMIDGEWITSTQAFFYMAPLFEMAERHFQFIPEVLYLTPFKALKDPALEANVETYVRSQAAYLPLQGAI